MVTIDLSETLAQVLASPAVTAVIKRIVREALAEAEPARSPALLNTQQAADLMGMTPAAVRKAAERGTIPCLRLGRNLRFRSDELLASVRR